MQPARIEFVSIGVRSSLYLLECERQLATDCVAARLASLRPRFPLFFSLPHLAPSIALFLPSAPRPHAPLFSPSFCTSPFAFGSHFPRPYRIETNPPPFCSALQSTCLTTTSTCSLSALHRAPTPRVPFFPTPFDGSHDPNVGGAGRQATASIHATTDPMSALGTATTTPAREWPIRRVRLTEEVLTDGGEDSDGSYYYTNPDGEFRFQ